MDTVIRLTEKHPTLKKFRQLEKLMNELKIEISFDGYEYKIFDKEINLECYIRDIENQDPINEIPSFIEYKLIKTY